MTAGRPGNASSERRSKWSRWPWEISTTSTWSPAGWGRGPWRCSGPRRARRNGSVRTRTPPISISVVAWPRNVTWTEASGPAGDDRVIGSTGNLAQARRIAEQGHDPAEDGAGARLDQVFHRVVVGQVHAPRAELHRDPLEDLPARGGGRADRRRDGCRLPARLGARLGDRAHHAGEQRAVGEVDGVV